VKRPLSAYMLYNNFRRPVLQGEHPDLSLPDLSKLIGEEWKNMSDDQKNIWKEKARGLKLDFEMMMLQMKNKDKEDQQEEDNEMSPPVKGLENARGPAMTPSKTEIKVVITNAQ